MEEPQEATFYQDDGISPHLLPHYLYDKNELQLNLHPVAPEPKYATEGMRKNATPSELRSPDFGILKLGSPELEKMIMSLQGTVTTSSTPCSFYNTTSNAPINSTNAESYSRGFTEALQDLHDKQSTGESLIDLADSAADISDPFLGNGGSLLNTTPVIRTTTEQQLVFPTNTTLTRNEPTTAEYFPNTSNLYSNSRGGTMYTPYPQATYPANCNVFSYPSDNLPYQDHFGNDGNTTAFRTAFSQYGNVMNQQKHELQPAFKIEPSPSQMIADPGILQPIDLEIQEVVKRERKKQRNRVASSKCRKRKLEREARLENRVKDLKERNIELNAVANALKQQVCDLKQKVMDHVGEGCQIMLVHQSQLSTS